MQIKALVFDLDGTLYLSGKPYPKAVETVQRVAEKVPVYYLSNNTSKSLVFYTNRLLRMGLPIQSRNSILSSMTFALSEIHRRGIKNLYLFANPEVAEWFAAEEPNPEMLAPLLKAFRPEEILFVGDRLYTDFELALRAGCRFALVLCGETKARDVQRLARQPEIIAEQVSDIDFDRLISGP